MEHSNEFYLQVELLLNDRYWDWRRTIDVIELIIAKINKFVKKWNFNRYQEPGKPLYVVLRFNIGIKDRDKIEEVLKNFKHDGIIVNFKLYDKPWKEPYFVIIAHELATQSALRFKHMVDKSKDLLSITESQVDLHRVISFFYCLMRYVLVQLNFRAPRLWEYERHSFVSSQKVSEIAKLCIPPRTKELLRKIKVQDRGSFLERYIHCFFNCIGRQTIIINNKTIYLENIVKGMLLDSILWEWMALSNH